MTKEESPKPERPKIVIKRVLRKDGQIEQPLAPAEIPKPEQVAERLLAKPTTIHVFVDYADHAFDPANLNEYLKKTFGPNFTFEFHGELTNYLVDQAQQPAEKVAEEFVRGKVWVGRQQGFGHIYRLSHEDKVKLEQELITLSPAEKKDFFDRSRSQKLIAGKDSRKYA